MFWEKLKNIDKKELFSKCVMIISITLFIVLTLINLANHNPWLDETIAWKLAYKMNFHNVISILSEEGHFIIWYLLILPFAKLNFHYPYPMLIINWLAYFLAILVMWHKAPFNSLYKIIITFSWVSLNYFSVVARCYSIGILGLFIIMSLYKEQTKRPYLYSAMLVLTAHTSLLATLPVVPLAFIFGYNLYKNRNDIPIKNILYPLIILFAGIFLWFLPFLHGYGYEDANLVNVPGFHFIIDFFMDKHIIMLYIYVLSLIWILFLSDSKIRFFTIFTIFEFVIFCSFIVGFFPHLIILLFVYLILSLWLTPKLHNFNIKTVPFIIFFFVLLYWNQYHHMYYTLDNTDKTEIVNYIKKQDKDIFLFLDTSIQDVIPYILGEYKYYGLPGDNNEYNIVKNVQNYSKKKKIKSKLLLISKYKINDSSLEFRTYGKNYQQNIYITELKNANEL